MKKGKFKQALLIDDNLIDNLINKKILEKNEIVENIKVYQSAIEAIDFLKDHLADKEEFPDFILLDIRMPEMDGFGFLEEFEKLDTQLKEETSIFVLSSSLDPADNRRMKANKRVVKFIRKPLLNMQLSGFQSK